ncbi:hypothetical protein OHA21_15190 [Actinoplanes sp. NBC_00393]|uniref:hypothetical protein n=1 Tax=Actinoplanes sp. NBC_00393 TaxID=2975953 RepID=UPI002E1C3323
MPFDLSGDRRCRIGGESVAAVGVVSADRFDQRVRCHLTQILEHLAALLETAGQAVRQWQAEPHGCVPQPTPFHGGAPGVTQPPHQIRDDFVSPGDVDDLDRSRRRFHAVRPDEAHRHVLLPGRGDSFGCVRTRAVPQ